MELIFILASECATSILIFGNYLKPKFYCRNINMGKNSVFQTGKCYQMAPFWALEPFLCTEIGIIDFYDVSKSQ